MSDRNDARGEEVLGPMEAPEAGARLQALGAALRHGLGVRCAGVQWQPCGPVRMRHSVARADDGEVALHVELRQVRGGGESGGLVRHPRVAVLVGSPSDEPKARAALEVLDGAGVLAELRVLSAHRTPDEVVAYVRDATQRGVQVFVAGAGLAAHLAGVVAAHTDRPVIGVPLAAGTLGGLDALLSTVQMPSGVPVATVAIDGMKNAAWLALRILALTDPHVARVLDRARVARRARYDAGVAPR